MVFVNYESLHMVLSEDMAIYKLRERVSGSLAPTLSWVVRMEQAGCSSPLDRTTRQSLTRSVVASKPFCISECLPPFHI